VRVLKQNMSYCLYVKGRQQHGTWHESQLWFAGDGGTPQVADGADYLGKFSFFFLIPPVIIGSSNSSSAWAACLFSLEYPRDELVIHHREIAIFSSSLFSPR